MKRNFIFFCVFSFLFVSGCSVNDYKIISGEVKSHKEQEISVNIPVEIEEIYVRQWQDIKLGDKLVKLDLSEIKRQITDSENQLKIANLELEQMQQTMVQTNKNYKDNLNTVQLQQDVINKQINLLDNKMKMAESNELPEMIQIQNNISATEKAYERAQEELESNLAIYESGGISEYQLKVYKDNVDKNKEQIEDLKISLESLKQKYIEDIKQALLNYRQQLYSIKNLESDIDDTQIMIQKEKILQIESKIESLKSKIKDKDIVVNNTINNGSIVEINVKKGSSVAASQTILSIIDTEDLYIQAYLPEYYSQGVKVGTEVVIIPLANKSAQLSGTIKEISNIAIQRDGEAVIPIKIEYKDDDKLLHPSFGVDVKIAR